MMGACVVCAETTFDWSQTIFVYITQGSKQGSKHWCTPPLKRSGDPLSLLSSAKSHQPRSADCMPCLQLDGRRLQSRTPQLGYFSLSLFPLYCHCREKGENPIMANTWGPSAVSSLGQLEFCLNVGCFIVRYRNKSGLQYFNPWWTTGAKNRDVVNFWITYHGLEIEENNTNTTQSQYRLMQK